MRFLFLLLTLALASCVTLDTAQVVGPDGTGDEALSEAVNRVEVSPSQFQRLNGATMTAEVKCFVGGHALQVCDYSAALEPNQDPVTFISGQEGGGTIVMKAENPGHTNLVVTALSGARAVVPIEIKKASE